MFYTADLHIHSHYASKTSKYLNLDTLYQWAQVKGIDVVGSGDFTHPAWLATLKERLLPDGNGFFYLKNMPVATALPGIRPSHKDLRFCLSAEVSTEYIHENKKRVVHHLLYAPDFETVKKINKKLGTYADLSADGRPTIILSSRSLMEIVLEASDRAYLVPAHAWTPWNAVFGSKNGHLSLEECYGDLSAHIFALETGLSSDPAMNRRWNKLDHITMMSNSDAHSPAKLGRELNLFDTNCSYEDLFNAVKTKKGFVGTHEFFPEEGKYTYDGHRHCGVCISPVESRDIGAICPVCKKQLTIGAMHQLDRLTGHLATTQSASNKDFKHVVPLLEILAEIHGTGTDSKKVTGAFHKAIAAFGNEFSVLRNVPVEDIHRFSPLLGTAISRMRAGEIKRIEPGYDNVYGKIHLFDKAELTGSGIGQLDIFS
ncbi:MAG: endonuclease Q family protein [Chitinophagaceae bacterium]